MNRYHGYVNGHSAYAQEFDDRSTLPHRCSPSCCFMNIFSLEGALQYVPASIPAATKTKTTSFSSYHYRRSHVPSNSHFRSLRTIKFVPVGHFRKELWHRRPTVRDCEVLRSFRSWGNCPRMGARGAGATVRTATRRRVTPSYVLCTSTKFHLSPSPDRFGLSGVGFEG